MFFLLAVSWGAFLTGGAGPTAARTVPVQMQIVTLKQLAMLVKRGEILAGAKPRQPVGQAWSARPDELMPKQEPEASIEMQWQHLAALTQTLLNTRREQSDATSRQAIQDFLVDVVRLEVDQKRVAPAEKNVNAEEASMESRFADLTPYLAARLHGSANFVIHAIKQLAGGYSNQTYRLMVGDSEATARPIVIRIARAWRPVGAWSNLTR